MTYEIIDLTKHFGSIVGTPGISDEIKDYCNEQLFKLVTALDDEVTKALATNRGIIT